MEEQLEIQKQHRSQQEKYIYYIIALSVTAIGYSVYRTTGNELDWLQLPLGMSIICWGLSIYCGLRFLKYSISMLYFNNKLFDVMNGRVPHILDNEEEQAEATIKINKTLKEINKIGKRTGPFHEVLFYSGIILFILWHILEMYNNTNPNSFELHIF